ncbi:putative protein serine/threonine kinase [Heterostelium album PN500]|uniref:Protein kinase domain-containing protein n=1 Tax=Heterostelium pallidum (strain ATCC 26659 / Pp 5 / PN500) TaxID=670386 RepID=D3BFS0_HETP5|nr:putative protein serine/threonine kinase [Heterostelium album PN500]EFA79680.1 putative protein serine/threonine kinase [Heterostelium album PN500]|eukprot:XP_020431801.1 putative protein serine/threonine kinase [Heterostelium album PN500]
MLRLFKKIQRKKGSKIEDYYELGNEIGRGAFSIVRQGTHKETGDQVAIKAISKQHVNDADMKRFTREIEIMKKLKHKNIIQLIEVFDSHEVRGGELFDKIVEKGQYSEKDACNLVRQIVSAVEYMHQHGVCHRDLKPENLLCSADDEAEQFVRIADFGLSKIFEGGEELKTACGTPDYVAPEILECKPYDTSVDMWSIGVITYILLCGFAPFYADTHHELFQKILDLEYDFPEPEWSGITDHAKDFISQLLVISPTERSSASQCMKHPWLAENNDNSDKDKRLDLAINSMKDYVRNRESNSSANLTRMRATQSTPNLHSTHPLMSVHSDNIIVDNLSTFNDENTNNSNINNNIVKGKQQLNSGNSSINLSGSSTSSSSSSSSSSISPLNSPYQNASGVILPITTTSQKDIASKNIYKWMIPTLEYLSLDNTTVNTQNTGGGGGTNTNTTTSNSNNITKKLNANNTNNKRIILSKKSSNNNVNSIKQLELQKVIDGTVITNTTIVGNESKVPFVPVISNYNDISSKSNNCDINNNSSSNTKSSINVKERNEWSSSIKTLCVTLDSIYGTLEKDPCIDKCNSMIQTLSTVLNDFKSLKNTLISTTIPTTQTPTTPTNDQVVVSVSTLTLPSTTTTTSISSSPSSTQSSKVEVTENNDNISNGVSNAMKWSDRLRIAMETMRATNNNNSNSNSTAVVDEKKQKEDDLNWELIRFKKAKQYEDRQQKAKENREAISVGRKRSYKHEDRVKEFNKRNEERVMQERITIGEKQERADQLHGEHITNIQQKGMSEGKKAEEIKWISDQTSKNQQYIRQRKLEKQAARRQKLALAKGQKMSLIVQREESALKRRREIEESRAQIILGAISSPPISDDAKRKIRRYCRYCNVPITSDTALQSHINELQHQNNLKHFNMEMKKTSLSATLERCPPTSSTFSNTHNNDRDHSHPDWVITLPFESFSTNRLAPLSKELLQKIHEEELSNKAKLSPTKQTLNKMANNNKNIDYLDSIVIPDDYFLKSTFIKTIGEIDSHLKSKDYKSLQFILMDTSVLLGKYSSQEDYLYFTKLKGLQSLSKICLVNNDPKPPSTLIKNTLELIIKLCSVGYNICYLLSLGTLTQFLELFSMNILSKPDIVVPFLPSLISLINMMFSIQSLQFIPFSIKEYKLYFIIYVLDLMIFEKLELKLPHLQLGMLEGGEASISMAEETIQMLVNFTNFFVESSKGSIEPTSINGNNPLELVKESAPMMSVLKRTNVVGVLSLLTFILLHNKKKQISHFELPKILYPTILQTLDLFINISMLDLPFVQIIWIFYSQH